MSNFCVAVYQISKWNSQAKEKGLWVNRDSSFIEFCKSNAAPNLSETDWTQVVKDGPFKGRALAAEKLCKAWAQLDAEEKTR